MDTFLTISGLIIGASLFLYSLSLLDGGRRKFSRTASNGVSGKKHQAESRFRSGSLAQNPNPSLSPQPMARQLPDEIKDKMPGRICPMCGKALSRDEPLYATHMNVGSQQKVCIHGCPYCYKESSKKKQGA